MSTDTPRRRRLRVLLASAVVAATGLSATVAHASPPSGLVRWTDHVRAQVVQGTTLDLSAKTHVDSAEYRFDPGADTGWWTAAGPSGFAVDARELTLYSAKGCSAQKYPAGRAAVVPAGRY